MKSSSKWILGVVALLLVVLTVIILLRLPGPSDRDQILAQMDSAATAAEHHDVGGIMKIVSADYHGSTPVDGNVDQLHLFLANMARNEGRVTVTLAPPSVQINGDTAVTVGQMTTHSEGGNYETSITLHWKKEDGRRWLIFPAKVWRVVGAQYQLPGGGDFGGGGFGGLL